MVLIHIVLFSVLKKYIQFSFLNVTDEVVKLLTVVHVSPCLCVFVMLHTVKWKIHRKHAGCRVRSTRHDKGNFPGFVVN